MRKGIILALAAAVLAGSLSGCRLGGCDGMECGV